MTEWRYDERSGMYYCLPEPTPMHFERHALDFDPKANVQAAARYIAARYGLKTDSGVFGPRAMERGRSLHEQFAATVRGYDAVVADGWEVFRDGQTWRYRPTPPFTRRWLRMVWQRMRREFRAAVRDAMGPRHGA